MTTKRLLICLLIALFSFGVFLEYAYQSKRFFRHQLDFQMNKLSTVHNETYSVLLLSDSITRMPLWNIQLKNDVLNLTTSAAVSVAGNYFILERFLNQNNRVDEIYFFVSPLLLEDNLDETFRYSHFESVFNKKNEKKTMESHGITKLYQKKDFFHQRYLSLLKSLSIKQENKSIFEKGFYIDEPSFIYLDKTNKKRNIDAIQELSSKEYKLSTISKIFLNKFISLANSHNIKVTFVMEPMPKTVYRQFLSSDMYINFLSIIEGNRYVDMNKLNSLPDYAMYDGKHLKSGWKQLYAKVINEQIVTIFPLITRQSANMKINQKVAVEIGTVFGGKQRVDGYFDNFCGGFTVTVPRLAYYNLYIDTYAKDEFSNSFYVGVNGGKPKVLHIPVSQDYGYSEKALKIKLKRGDNKVLLCIRENTPLKEFIIRPL